MAAYIYVYQDESHPIFDTVGLRCALPRHYKYVQCSRQPLYVRMIAASSRSNSSGTPLARARAYKYALQVVNVNPVLSMALSRKKL